MSNESDKNNLGLTAYAEKININLFNDIIAFVMATTSADTTDVYSKLSRTHLWYIRSENDNIQEQYGFRYFGELLERFEDKAGSDIKDIRAIALAMAYTKDLFADNMFVGNQKANFISKIRRLSATDTYLKGALYLLLKNESGTEKLLEILTRVTYSRTEELVFILSLYDDFDQGFDTLKPQLLRLLGPAKTIELIANSGVYNWLIRELCYSETIKGIRTKDMALFRAFMEIPVAFVKPGSRHHKTLLEHGHTDEEILFLNSYIIRRRAMSRCLNTNSITAEKLAVETLITFINSENTHPHEAYEHMKYLLNKYSNFAIKISGHSGIYEAIVRSIKLLNPQTFLWLYNNLAKKEVFDFDILDSKWDVLSEELNADEYLMLFNCQLLLNKEETGEQLNARISKYEELTGLSFIQSFEFDGEYNKHLVFKLLVNKDIINLTQLFASYINSKAVTTVINDKDRDDERHEINTRASVFSFMHVYVKGIQTRQAFDFFKSLYEKYSYSDLYQFFVIDAKKGDNYNSRDYFFVDEFYNGPARSYYRYGESKKSFNIERSFLDETEQKELFNWIDDYMFQFKTKEYIDFAVCMIQDEFIRKLLSHNELRQLFDMINDTDNNYFKQKYVELKAIYLTENELQAERDAEKAKKEKKKQEEIVTQIRELKDKLQQTFDGSLKSILNFVDANYYSRNPEVNAFKIACEYLPIALAKSNNCISVNEFGHFLQLCGKVIKHGLLSIADTKKYILMIEEVEEIVEHS